MQANKKPQKPHLNAKKGDFESSSLSGVTNKHLIINKLGVYTDKIMTKLNYKKPKVYDAGGDLKKQWFVFYSYKNPVTNKFERFKVFKEINTEQTKAGRYELANYYKAVITDWLEKGHTPYQESTRSSASSQGVQNIVYCVDQFLEYVENTKLRHNTKRKYRLEMTVFKTWLADKGYVTLRIGEIKKQHIFEFIEDVKKERKITSGKTSNAYLNDIRRFFNHYIDNYDDYLDRNPATKITRDMVEEKGNLAYTEQEFTAIKNYLLNGVDGSKPDPYLWFVCQVIYYTGLRNEAEALELRCGDFDLKNKMFFVESWIAKNKTRQSVPIYPEFQELLESLNLNQYPADWYLFGREDKPGPLRVGIRNFAKRFRNVKLHFGFGNDYGLYAFKSTRACHLFDDGASLRDIQILFRHSDPYVTMKYLKSLGRVERGRVYDKGRKI